MLIEIIERMNNFRFFIFTCLFSPMALNVVARQDISLEKMVKLRLLERPGGLSSSDMVKKFEVINEKGVWKSYQFNDSLTKTFIKVIPKEELVHLLKIINTKDTSIKMELFNMKHQEMVVAFDSLIKVNPYKDEGLTSVQKAVFFEACLDKKQIEAALRSILIPSRMDDKTEYKITITTKSGKEKVIAAYSFASIYNLPWNIDDKQVYNPNISRIFASLTGDERFDKQFKGFLYKRLIQRIFWSKFRSAYLWRTL